MNQPSVRHGFTRGRRLWLCLALGLGLALGSQPAAAKECHRETPMPTEVRLMAPGPEVPEALARFAGAWIGASEALRRSDPLCHILVVEEVFANGYARVIYSYSSAGFYGIRLPGFLHATGRIIDGELRFQVPIRERPQIAYRVAGETLESTFAGPDGVIRLLLSRVADLSQVGCIQQGDRLPPTPPAIGPRNRLTAGELLTPAEAGTGLVHNEYFMPVGQVAPALHAFKGTLTLQAATMLRARHGCPGLAEPFPSFTLAFFTHGEHLVPVVRDVLNPPGTLILSSGQMWSELGDGGMSRASFPFVLTNAYNNATRNGLATFLYDDSRVSALRFQVVQETAAWAKYDGWGQTHMTYTPGPIDDAEAVRAPFAAELQHQTPIRPWSALPAIADTPGLRDFDGDTAPEDVSVSGVIVDGVLYLRGCETRYGPYPYCRQMRHGVFSVTKSLGAAIALLRLAQKYGDQVFDLKITDYVTVTAAKLAEALDTTEARGLPSRQENRFGEGRYHLSFWSVPYRTATGCIFQIPYMSGFGGNVVMLLPNGLSAFRFADGHHYDVDTMVLAGEALRPFPCPAESAETPPPARSPLTASDLRTEVPGNTFYRAPVTNFPMVLGGRLTMFVSVDGRLYGTFTRRPAIGPEYDVGRWHITPAGVFCRTWHVWDNRRERCYTLHLSLPVMYRGGESFEFALTERWGAELYRRVPGNPKGY